MKRLTIIIVLLATVALVSARRDSVAGVETGFYHGEAVTCAVGVSTDPHVGANYMCLGHPYSASKYYHDLFNNYNTTKVEQALNIMDAWNMRYVRVFDGDLMSGYNTFKSGVKNNILDFLTRANNHGLKVFFTITNSFEPWMATRYHSIKDTNNEDTQSWTVNETIYNTPSGRQVFAERLKYIVQQCFASRSQDIVISVKNEPFFIQKNDNGKYWAYDQSETNMRDRMELWLDEMDTAIRSVDTRSNHKVAVSLIQHSQQGTQFNFDGVWTDRWVWEPKPAVDSNIDVIDMHFYDIKDTNDGWPDVTDEFDESFDPASGYNVGWANSCSKDIMIGEMGSYIHRTDEGTTPYPNRDDNEKVGAQKILNLIGYVKNAYKYRKITDVILWRMVPYRYTTSNGAYDPVDSSGNSRIDTCLHHILTDGHQGYTRMGASIAYNEYKPETCSTNYTSYYLNRLPAALNDYDDSTLCHVRHKSDPNDPTVFEINFNGQYYRFHKIRVVDTCWPYPRDFVVEIYNGTTWIPFGDPDDSTGNTQSSVDIVSTATSGWQSGCKVRVKVYYVGTGSTSWWSTSLAEIYINPVTYITE